MDDTFLRGVNLGGWLVLERWMTPGLFAGTKAVDEYTFMQAPGAEEKIRSHRQTFIAEEDFRWIKESGLNAVRIPVGYWVLEGDWSYLESREQLDWAMEMAEKYSLRVIIDVHGLPGSQNGRDHSGRVGRSKWYGSKIYRQESVRLVAGIAKRYADHPALWGIQVINEPRLGVFHVRLRAYYQRVYCDLVNILPQSVRIITSDAFTPRLMSGALRKSSHPVAMDVHSYHMATPLAQLLSVEWFFAKLRRRKKLFELLSRTQPLIIGEWSGVLSHKTMRNVPPQHHDRLFADYVRLQQDVYSVTSGWFYWNYKTEKPGQWNFRSQVEAGLIDVIA